jgi:E1A/CREB-binding protein
MMPNMQNQNNFSGQSISPNVQQQRSPSANQASMPPPGMNGNNMQFNQMSSSSQQPNQFQSGSAPSGSNMYGPAGQPNPMSSSVSNYASNQRSGSSSGGNNGGRSDSEWTKIRHKQQRLLLLRHASRCQHEPSKCPVTPHCAAMKKLWEHIAHCKNQNCEVAHCMSSRYVLSHYRRCKDNKCPACGPVRETIRKSHEREKHRNNDPLSSGFGDQGSSNYQQQNKRMKLEQAAPDQMIPGQRRGSVAPGPAEVSSATADKKEGKPLAKVTEDRSLLNSFTVEQLTTHLASLNRASQLPPAKLKSECSAVLKGLQTHQHGWVFNAPVDPVELGLPDYFDVIKKPMDLGTVHKRLDAGQYHSIEDFKRDVNLTFDNAMTYNESGTVVYDMAKELKEKFEMDYEAMMIQLDEEDRERRQNDRACVLCGCEKLLFEPPVFFCNGMNCQSKRIRRNSHFYIGGNNQYFWCNQCYNELDDKIPIELIDMTIKKGDLTKKKNDETHEESWVQCDVCERWIHQICGLFNTRQNKEHHSEYSCPMCLLEKRKKEGNPPPKKPPGAEDLPRTKLSECLEKHVSKMIDQKVKQLAAEKSTTEVRYVSDFMKS